MSRCSSRRFSAANTDDPVAARLYRFETAKPDCLVLLDLALATYDAKDGVGLFSSIFSLVVIVPAFLVYIKRWHDRDKSGWWMLIVLIPLVGLIWFLVELGFLPGTPGPNRFGPPPSD